MAQLPVSKSAGHCESCAYMSLCDMSPNGNQGTAHEPVNRLLGTELTFQVDMLNFVRHHPRDHDQTA
jgi:hypothetical protein